jgi:hypothetical protein
MSRARAATAIISALLLAACATPPTLSPFERCMAAIKASAYQTASDVRASASWCASNGNGGIR